jgi:ATP-dependent helicase/nuclease subunit A
MADASPPATPTAPAASPPAPAPAPDWLDRAAPESPRAAPPLRPSGLLPAAPDGAPALTGAGSPAALRGRLLHRLFERLGGVPAPGRAAHARRLLGSMAPAMDPAERDALADEALGAIALDSVEPLFGPEALAEVALAGRVRDTLVEGRVDRLLVEPGRVRLIEFKTGARAPRRADDVHPAHLAQVAAYWAVARLVWPGRAVEAGLLYTSAPRYIAVPPATLASHAPGGDCGDGGDASSAGN